MPTALQRRGEGKENKTLFVELPHHDVFQFPDTSKES